MKADILLREIEKRETGQPLAILEIGTIRNTAPEYADGDGHSTEHIANHIKGKGYRFISVDIKTDVCGRYLKEKGLTDTVTLVKSDGLTFINNYKSEFDIIYLDGANYSDETLKQYFAAKSKIKQGGVIIIDDCFPDSPEVVKCHAVLKHLADCSADGWYIEDNMLIIQF